MFFRLIIVLIFLLIQGSEWWFLKVFDGRWFSKFMLILSLMCSHMILMAVLLLINWLMVVGSSNKSSLIFSRFAFLDIKCTVVKLYSLIL